MSDGERVLAVREWFVLADGDLRAAEVLLSASGVPAWSAGFHVQQCAEKYLKGLLTALGIAFPKSPDVGELIARLPACERPSVDPQIVADLSDYAVGARYPGRPEPTMEEVRGALDAVRTMRAWVRARLPPTARVKP
jgi:HEPN domain-containing protein